MTYTKLIKIEMCLSHLIEEQQKLIKLPFFVHLVLKTAQFVERSDQHIRSKSFIIETIDKFQDVLRVQHPHVSCLLFYSIEIQPIDHDRFYRVDFS